MITLTLPDGSNRDLEAPVTGAEFAASISKSLAKKALAVDGLEFDVENIKSYINTKRNSN